ncbi:MAG TPA: hypothetical protein VHP37_10370 [Burkholderiales bacterium]|nr:hypothetical protein [Burkholderiales bacterium]
MTAALFYLLSASAHAATAEDPLAVRAMINAGAVELALSRIDALQPRDMAAAQWAEWEGLRCEALARLKRFDTVFARANALPGSVSSPALHACYVAAAQAAVALNEPAAARAHAAQLLWQRKASEAETREVRLAVIDSYLVEKRGDEAFRSMLRFQQDYQPLDRATADRFAAALLDLSLDREALNWLGRTDQVSPTLLRLQLRSGTLTPDAVISQARAALARDPDPLYFRAIQEAAARSGERQVQVEALERILQATDPRNASSIKDGGDRLWQAYAAAANEVANREQLLVGDDGAFADYAARRLGTNAVLSRAFYGYLARQAGNPALRRDALLQLAFSLSSAGLDRTALALTQSMGLETDTLDAQTRHLLGTLAARRHDAALAMKLWKGLPAPPNVDAAEWQLTLARTALQAGDAEASADTLRAALEGRKTLTADYAQHVLDVAQEMLDLRALDPAQKVYEALVPATTDVRAREALFGLGRVNELKGDANAAAAAYLRSALLMQAAAPDNLAYQARLLAALNLMRAGHKDDARAQFEWLLRNSKDAALTEAAKRGLGRL